MRLFSIFILLLLAMCFLKKVEAKVILGKSLYDINGNLVVANKNQSFESTVVIIFNPGTSDWSKPQPCQPSHFPVAIKRLNGVKINNKTVNVLYLCSFEFGLFPGDLTPKRSKEIAVAVQYFYKQGVPSSHIFLAGQSRGGWSSLYYASKYSDRIGGVILFAPAIHGPRPISNIKVVKKHIEQFRQAKKIQGMLFTHPKDEFFRPQEHRFAKDIEGLQVYSSMCPDLKSNEAHFFAYKECSLLMLPRIQKFIFSQSLKAHNS